MTFAVDAWTVQTANGTLATLPSGFRPKGWTCVPVIANGQMVGNFLINYNGAGTLGHNLAKGQPCRASWTFITPDPWPTVLPGSPA